MTTICTSTVHHGDTRLIVHSAPHPTRAAALEDAIALTDIGYRPSDLNRAGALEVLERYDRGARPSVNGYLSSRHGHASLSEDSDGTMRIQIGWCDFTFSSPVRLWAISAQVVLETFDGTTSRQVPTFYLDPAVQGVTDQHGAIRVAHDVLMTMAGDSPEVHLHVSAEPVY